MVSRVGYGVYNNPYWDHRLSRVAFDPPVHAVSAIQKTAPIIDPLRYFTVPDEEQQDKPKKMPPAFSFKPTWEAGKSELLLDRNRLEVDYNEIEKAITEQQEDNKEDYHHHQNWLMQQKMNQYMYFTNVNVFQHPHYGGAGKYLNYVV
ncbi:hypothetical protein F9B85_03060 [Heliorestis acidaminivorans]|uniref:Uncharacterized protein n=1 Tax=Heliorestis acidaminivorans TaxID=553427 RepID=A0A6I0ESN7_9FIRM|nr:hypothetical protein [Heliorestis acidaminivorans]KAB2953615.1 hypothetical protein F9B85_03060 [Heliorestis acidaminivorans]